jgi:hypothetical protein
LIRFDGQMHHSRLYVILQTTQYNTHTEALFIFLVNVRVGKCLSDQIYFWANVLRVQ